MTLAFLAVPPAAAPPSAGATEPLGVAAAIGALVTAVAGVGCCPLMVEGFRVEERVTGVEGGAIVSALMVVWFSDQSRVQKKSRSRREGKLSLPTTIYLPLDSNWNKNGHQASDQDVPGYLPQGKHQDGHRVLRVLCRSSPPFTSFPSPFSCLLLLTLTRLSYCRTTSSINEGSTLQMTSRWSRSSSVPFSPSALCRLSAKGDKTDDSVGLCTIRYGLPMLTTTDESLKAYLQAITDQVQGSLPSRCCRPPPLLGIPSSPHSPLYRFAT
jgi:hypothetical protein